MIKIKRNKEKEPSKARAWEAILIFTSLVVIMLIGLVFFDTNPHILMFIGVCIVSIVTLIKGYKWTSIEKMMLDGIYKALPALLILLVVGILVGIWIICGTIPTMIDYGLKLLNPKIFLIATTLITSITSLATGTAWGTLGTMGLALITIGQGLGVPIGPTAGAIISGAYFGDKMSPLSDSTNLAPNMAGTDIFTHIKFMIKPTGIAYLLTLIFFGVYGFFCINDAEINSDSVVDIINNIESSFFISPILLIPPLTIVISIILKIPALPAITIGAIVGAIFAVIFQTELLVYNSDIQLVNIGVNFGNIITSAKDGFFFNSENESLNNLLTSGGLMSMTSSILMAIISMMFGGVMESTGMLEAFVSKFMRFMKKGWQLVLGTEMTCLFSNIVMPDQYISILIPGRMFASAYRKNGYHPKCLSNALESCGTVTSPLIPWNTCGVYIDSTLGVSTFGPNGYFIWCIFNLIMPIVNIILAILGVTIKKMTKEEQAKADAGQLV